MISVVLLLQNTTVQRRVRLVTSFSAVRMFSIFFWFVGVNIFVTLVLRNSKVRRCD